MFSNCAITTIFSASICFYIFWNDFSNSGFIFVICCVIISMIPTLLVHLQYLKRNFKKELNIDNEKKSITFYDKGHTAIYSFTDIKDLSFYSSYGKSNSGLYSFAKYEYCEISFIDSTSIYVTCLMIGDLKYTLSSLLGLEYISNYRLIAYIY